MTQTQQQCSTPDHLLMFLRGQLSSQEESELQLHLNDCVSCRERLEDAAADANAWNEAKQFFGNGGLHGLTDDSTGDHEEATQGSQRIRQVLDALGPTDDPESLGRIGGYEVTGVVGAGGMGVVLKAHDRSLDRIVAIKVMSPHLASSGSARKRFAREAKAAAAVLHPNVIAIHSVASEDANPYLVMPYVRGASLQKRIDSQGPLPLKDTLRIGAQIAAGLAAAHEQGLVHRDIKPANILLEEGVERVTITDFGLARAVDDASMTCSGVIAGTPQYMSPEQTRGEPIDARSDLFSLGSVLYAMCAGRSPFRAETTYGVLHRIANDIPTPVSEVNSDVPVWLGHIIERLMTKRPEDRFDSAAQVAELLEGCLAHVQQPAVISLPVGVQALAAQAELRASEIPKPNRLKAIHQRILPFTKYIAAASAFALFFAGILIVLELDKGTLTIKSETDDVPIRIMRGETVTKTLRITKGENSIRIASGTYVIEIDGQFHGIEVKDGHVTLGRRGEVVVRVIQNVDEYQGHLSQPRPERTSFSNDDLLRQMQGRWQVTRYMEDGRDDLHTYQNRELNIEVEANLMAIRGMYHGHDVEVEVPWELHLKGTGFRQDVDILYDPGDTDKPCWLPGIIELKDGRLRLCCCNECGASAEKRPQHFASMEHTWLLEAQRLQEPSKSGAQSGSKIETQNTRVTVDTRTSPILSSLPRLYQLFRNPVIQHSFSPATLNSEVNGADADTHNAPLIYQLQGLWRAKVWLPNNESEIDDSL